MVCLVTYLLLNAYKLALLPLCSVLSEHQCGALMLQPCYVFLSHSSLAFPNMELFDCGLQIVIKTRMWIRSWISFLSFSLSNQTITQSSRAMVQLNMLPPVHEQWRGWWAFHNRKNDLFDHEMVQRGCCELVVLPSLSLCFVNLALIFCFEFVPVFLLHRQNVRNPVQIILVYKGSPD